MEDLFIGEQLAQSREILERFQAPRFTTANRDLIYAPREGQVIFNKTTLKLNFYNGTSWKAITSA